jgi:hypothetical protein
MINKYYIVIILLGFFVVGWQSKKVIDIEYSKPATTHQIIYNNHFYNQNFSDTTTITNLTLEIKKLNKIIESKDILLQEYSTLNSIMESNFFGISNKIEKIINDQKY